MIKGYEFFITAGSLYWGPDISGLICMLLENCNKKDHDIVRILDLPYQTNKNH